MKILYGDALDKFLKVKLKNIDKKRFCYSELEGYIMGNDYNRICCLYGLRRTGKSTMMYQAMEDLMAQGEQCLLVNCGDGDTTQDLRRVLKNSENYKYVFVDEATKMTNFINTSSIFADIYAGMGIHIVMSGTDSLGFNFAKADELYDRMIMIHTSHISFKEYNYILGKNLMEYLRYGGTLTDGEVFYNSDNLREYTNTAIADNITHSLKYLNQGRNYGELGRLLDNRELKSGINKVIEIHNRKIALGIFNGVFYSHDLGSANDLLIKRGLEPIEADENFMAELRFYLDIKEEHSIQLNQDEIDEITEYLLALDVLYKVPGKDTEYIFTQPGMRYCQLEAIKTALMNSDMFNKYDEVVQNAIIKVVDSDIKGKMMEDVIFFELLKETDPKYKISKYRKNKDNYEVDVVFADLDNEKMVLAEVKLSDKRHSTQLKNLENEDFIADIKRKYGCRIRQKVCLYMGESGYNEKHDVIYLNAEEFLKDKKQYTEELFSGKLCETLNKVEVEEPEVKKQQSHRGR
jgi:predicted AAA+ superfamily ATPase